MHHSSTSVTIFPDEPHRAYLALFDVRDRSSIANLFYEAVRNGASTVAEVLATMSADINRRVRDYGKYDDAWSRRRAVVFAPANREAARRFAQYALDRELGNVPKYSTAPECDSHLEDLFLHSWRRWLETEVAEGRRVVLPANLLELTPAQHVGVYTVDFVLLPLKIAVELDGHDYHKTREQRANDARKGRFLVVSGWLLFRYTGNEVHADPPGCCAELYRLAVRRGAFELPYQPIAKECRA